MKEKDYLSKKISPYDPSKVKTLEDALMQLQGCSFQGRTFGNSLEVLTNMVTEKKCLRVLTLAGALIPAGMEEVICQAIERKVINAIVSTGANIIHSILNAFDKDHQAHYMGTQYVDDKELYKYRINRIYDTYLPEQGYINAEDGLKKILIKLYGLKEKHVVKPSELFATIAKNLPGRSFLSVAEKNNVPVFCGATSDSEVGLDLVVFRKEGGPFITLDEIGDVDTFGELIQKYDNHGTIILGGGVPRNWTQQIFPLLDQLYGKDGPSKYTGYKYSVRFHSAVAEDGGLSGCTLNESISWGKYSVNATCQSVWGDSTVYFPLVMTALFQRIDRLGIKIE